MKKIFSKSAQKSITTDDAFNKLSLYDKSFKPVRRLQDARLGEISLMTDPLTKENVFVQEKKFNEKEAMLAAITHTKEKMQNQTPYCLRILDYSASKQNELCSTVYVLRQFYEYFTGDLKAEFITRHASNLGFNSVELAEILYRTVKADPFGNHGDICPTNMLYSKTPGSLRLVNKNDGLNCNVQAIATQKAKMIANQALYQSQTMYSSLKNKIAKFDFDCNKEDAFALGLVLLEMGNLSSIANIYDSTKKEIDKTILRRHIDDFHRKYGASTFLGQAVEGLTRITESERLGMREFAASLPGESEFLNNIGASSVFASPIGLNTSAVPLGISSHRMGAARDEITKIETMVTTTPVPPEPMPSIYAGMDFANNIFYQTPVLPVLASPNSRYGYTPTRPNSASASKPAMNRTNIVETQYVPASANKIYNQNYPSDLKGSAQRGTAVVRTMPEYTRPISDFSGTYNQLPMYSHVDKNGTTFQPEARREVVSTTPIVHLPYQPQSNAVAEGSRASAVYAARLSQLASENSQALHLTNNYQPAIETRKSYTKQSISGPPPPTSSLYKDGPTVYPQNTPSLYGGNVASPIRSYTNLAAPSPAHPTLGATYVSASPEIAATVHYPATQGFVRPSYQANSYQTSSGEKKEYKREAENPSAKATAETQIHVTSDGQTAQRFVSNQGSPAPAPSQSSHMQKYPQHTIYTSLSPSFGAVNTFASSPAVAAYYTGSQAEPSRVEHQVKS